MLVLGKGNWPPAIVFVQLVDGVRETPTDGKRVLAVEIDGLFRVDTEPVVVRDGILYELQTLSDKRAGLHDARVVLDKVDVVQRDFGKVTSFGRP